MDSLYKMCRCCFMKEGSRNIFEKSNILSENSISLDKLVEKLRFVACLQISDNDNLPYLLCDLCIVQLNVAYNFKQKTIETETKYRQMIIEKGLNYMGPSRLQQNKTANVISPTSTSSHVTEFATDKVLQHRPIFIKTEPIECDHLSEYSMNDFTIREKSSVTPIIAVVPNVEPNSLENRKSDSKFINEYLNLNSPEESKHTVVNPLNVKNKGARRGRKPKGQSAKELATKSLVIKKTNQFRKSRTNNVNYNERKTNKPRFTVITKEQKNARAETMLP